MKRLSKITVWALFLFLGLALSCNHGNVQNQNNSEKESVNQDQTTENTGTVNWMIIKLAGQEVGKISKNTNDLQFSVQGVEYQSKLKGDKRKYATKSGEIIVEVKYKDDGFKVRKPDGSLLWKIKLYDDKVKISNNEENLNPYEIKLNDKNKAKLKKDDKTIGEIKFKASDKQVEITAGSKSFYVEADKISLAYGALLIDEIPENIRYIIAVELLAKGK
jgi:hypothetical protein